MKRLVILLFFATLIGFGISIAPGVSYGDFGCLLLFLFVLFKSKEWPSNNIIAKTSFVYSLLLLFSGIVNGTITNTIFLNFTRIFIEGTVAFVALLIVLKGKDELKFFSYIAVIYSIVYLILSTTSINASIEMKGNFEKLDIQTGRNGMGVTNLLIIIMLTFLLLKSEYKKYKLVLILFPFLVFNIIFSASRFSVISLGLFALFIIYILRNKMSKGGVISLVAFFAMLIYIVNYLESSVDSDVMSYSTELLYNKLEKNEDGGFAYRINVLNIDPIVEWLNISPLYMILTGDGISITHGIFSFTFCCTGLVGFLYFVIAHIKMIVVFGKKTFLGKYMAFLIFVFFFNDIVTNSRFIIGVNNLLYMGMLACMYSYYRLLNGNNIINQASNE